MHLGLTGAKSLVIDTNAYICIGLSGIMHLYSDILIYTCNILIFIALALLSSAIGLVPITRLDSKETSLVYLVAQRFISVRALSNQALLGISSILAWFSSPHPIISKVSLYQ